MNASTKPDRRVATRKSTASASEGPKRPRRTQAERREDSERRLLEAALSIVARNGTVRLTLADVGTEAGFSRGLATHRFGSKAGLLRALAAHITERFFKQIRAAPPRKAGLDSIRGHISVYFGRPPKDLYTTRALLSMLTEGLLQGAEIQQDMAAHARATEKFFEHHLRVALRKGEVRPDVDPKTDAVLLMGTLRGVMLQELLKESPSLHKVRDRILAVIDHAWALKPASPKRR